MMFQFMYTPRYLDEYVECKSRRERGHRSGLKRRGRRMVSGGLGESFNNEEPTT